MNGSHRKKLFQNGVEEQKSLRSPGPDQLAQNCL